MEVIAALLAEDVRGMPETALTIERVVDTYHGEIGDVRDFYVAIVLRTSPDDYGFVRILTIRIINEEGEIVLKSANRGQINVPDPPPYPDWQVYLSLHLQCTLRNYGRHEMEIMIDGHRRQYLPFYFVPPSGSSDYMSPL